MNLTSLHILLTYKCIYECDHCFVWGSPDQTGVFTLKKLEEVFQQATEVESINELYFEGGEAFLYYPTLIKAVTRATALGFSTGIVSNGYWANSVDDARAWLQMLVEAGLNKIEISSDLLHSASQETPESHPGIIAAQQLGLSASIISLEPPNGYCQPTKSGKPGRSANGGDIMFRGRAAEKLVKGMAVQPWTSFTSCPYENMTNPGRIHLDPFGNLHLCQGLVMGNLFERSLKEIVDGYDPATHPIVGPLLAGGPTQLVQHYSLAHDSGYVDACHLCYTARKKLRPRFPTELAPDQMYGVPDSRN